jgi:hypothetical protein
MVGLITVSKQIRNQPGLSESPDKPSAKNATICLINHVNAALRQGAPLHQRRAHHAHTLSPANPSFHTGPARCKIIQPTVKSILSLARRHYRTKLTTASPKARVSIALIKPSRAACTVLMISAVMRYQVRCFKQNHAARPNSPATIFCKQLCR